MDQTVAGLHQWLLEVMDQCGISAKCGDNRSTKPVSE